MRAEDFFFRSGVRSAERKMDGQLVTLHFKAKTPNELALFMAAESRTKDAGDDASVLAREQHRAAFVASSLCDEAGKLIFTNAEQVQQVPPLMKMELAYMIVQESNKTDSALGKGLQPGVMNGLTTP